MRGNIGFAITALALKASLASLASAQGVDSGTGAIPECAVPCLVENIAQSTCAADQSPACICTNAGLQQGISLCVTANCSIKDALATKNATHSTCGGPVHDQAATYDTTSIILAAISFSMVAVRIGFKLSVTRSLSSDDYVVIGLVVVALPSVLITHYGTAPNGVGRDIWTLTPRNITDFLFYFYLMAILYFIQVVLIKLCLLLFYLRIFPGQGVRRLLRGTVVFNVLFGIVFFFLAIFQCTPVSHYWEGWHGEHEGTCLSKSAIAWSNAGISIALDFWMLAIPLAQLRTLSLHWKKKIGVALMFCVGTFVTIVSIIRLQALVVFAASDNATWDNFPVSLWSTVEINVGIMCTCMPTLRLLLVRLFPALDSRSSYAMRYHNSGGGHLPSNRVRTNQARRLADPTTAKSNSGVELRGDPDVAPTKPLGIVRKQSFIVQYDDDETSLVQMRGLVSAAPSQKSDDSKLP